MKRLACFTALALLVASPLAAQAPDTEARVAAQRTAMARLAFMDGTWRGTAWTQTREGRHELVQTERPGRSWAARSASSRVAAMRRTAA